MEASQLLHHILIFLFIRSVLAEVKLEDGCIQYNANTTITCTLPSGYTLSPGFIFWKFNNAYVVSNGVITVGDSKYDIASSGNTFSLTIHNLTMDDIGIYNCEQLGDLDLDFNLEKNQIEDITCNATGDNNEMVITIEYNKGNPEAVAVEKTVTCVDVSTSAGEPTAGTCTFNNLAAGTYSYIVNNHGECNLMCTGQVTVTEAPTTTPSMNAPTTGTPGLEDWKIALIVIVVIIFVLGIALIVVYIVCFQNKPKGTGGYFAGLSSYCCFKRCYCCCSDQASTSSQVYPTPAPDQNSSPRRDVTVITVKNDTASENYYEAVSRRDVTVITVKNDTASENFPTGGQGLSLPNNKADNLGSVNTTDLSPKSNKLPPLEHPDTETVDEIQKKTKKEKNRKKRRSKSTKEENENETEEPDDGELLHEVGI